MGLQPPPPIQVHRLAQSVPENGDDQIGSFSRVISTENGTFTPIELRETPIWC